MHLSAKAPSDLEELIQLVDVHVDLLDILDADNGRGAGAGGGGSRGHGHGSSSSSSLAPVGPFIRIESEAEQIGGTFGNALGGLLASCKINATSDNELDKSPESSAVLMSQIQF